MPAECGQRRVGVWCLLVGSWLTIGKFRRRDSACKNIVGLPPSIIRTYPKNQSKHSGKRIGSEFRWGTRCLYLWLFVLWANGQSALDLWLSSTVNIQGAIGTVYALQTTTTLDLTNSWLAMSFIQLTATNQIFTDISPVDAGVRFYRTVEVAPTDFVFIRPGTFRMGTATNEVDRNDPQFGDEGPQTEVTLTRGFLMQTHEVTQAEYSSLVEYNPSTFQADVLLPVEGVSWNDATNYCARRTAADFAAGIIPAGAAYRLPAEAEWEYACRALTSTRFFYGDDPGYTNLTKYAWYSQNSGGATHPVAQKLPNPWGLFDMSGNVAEWCQDEYGTYAGGVITDPVGSSSGETNAVRVIRGGLWGPSPDLSDSARLCRSGWRTGKLQNDSCYCVGFRIVLAPAGSYSDPLAGHKGGKH